MTDSHTEARRLVAAGLKLCELHPMSKRPKGDDWNRLLITSVDAVRDTAGGFGIPLAVNGLCSVDFDNLPLAAEGLHRCGLEVRALREWGVSTSSTRPGSGGRVAFRVPDGSMLRWLRFTHKQHGTILELRASSANLQDCLPGTVYKTASGGPYRQDYDGLFSFDCAPLLPEPLLRWWERMSNDLMFLHEQQFLLVGPEARLDISIGSQLAFQSPYRAEFNRTHRVEDFLIEHGYPRDRSGRYSCPTASGGPGIRRIPNKDDLWQSDHASDPLFGTFDAWSAYVVLKHDGKVETAEAEADLVWATEAVEGFEETEVVPYQGKPMLPAPEGPKIERLPAQSGPLPNFERDKAGKPKATVNNLVAALRRSDVSGIQIGFDRFRDEIMVCEPGTDQWRTFSDADYVWLRLHLEGANLGFAPIGRELVRDVVLAVSAEHSFDSAELWLNGLHWDGVPRIDTFFPHFFSAEDTPYHRAVGAYLWTAMAGRVLQPGCKADMVPILVGNQGVGKSTAVSAMVPSPNFFTEVSFSEKDDDLSRKMRGKLIAEIGELRGLHTKELEAIKAFITRTHEHWIPKFREFQTTFPRRLVFIGTTNKDQFLADETGNRRFLPVRVGQVNVPLLQITSGQLWAEAAVRFRSQGVEWKQAQSLAEAVHEEFSFQDEWEPKVQEWLEDPLFGDSERQTVVPLHAALIGAIGLDSRSIGRKDELRMASVLRKIGYIRKKVRIDGRLRWAFVPVDPHV